MINQLTIIGTGLMGCSVALALKRTAYCKTIVGYDQQFSTTQQALQLGSIDQAYEKLEDAVTDADLILFALPVGSFEKTLAAAAPHLKKNTLITDLGSSKQTICTTLADQLPMQLLANCVPAHPIAGSEQSGPQAASANLFDARTVILTPLAETSSAATASIQDFWQKAGAHTEIMSAEQHDQILAVTSHLPHVLAFAYMESIAQRSDCAKMLNYCGGGFRDFTRIAAANPRMWADICLANRDALLASLTDCQAALQILQNAIETKDEATIQNVIQRAKLIREQYEE